MAHSHQDLEILGRGRLCRGNRNSLARLHVGPSSATSYLCNLEPVSAPLWAFISSIKRANKVPPLQATLKHVIHEKCLDSRLAHSEH